MAVGKDGPVRECDFEIRPYTISDQEAVLKMWADVFGKDLSRNLWHWKYIGNPFGHRILLCVRHTGEIMALYGGIPYHAQWREKRIEMIQLMDIMSHPQYRGAGYFARTAQAFFDTYAGSEKSPLLYGFPGKQHFDIGVKYLHYSGLGDGAVYLAADAADTPAGGLAKPSRVSELTRPDESFGKLWQACRRFFPLAVVRDRQFVQWRFFDHPCKTYDVWGAYENAGGGLTAYAVVRPDAPDAILVDYLSVPDQTLVSGFLSRLKTIYQKRGVRRIVTWLPAGHFLRDMFTAAGFDPEPEPIGIIPTARSFDENLTMAWVSGHIYYTMADGDLF